MQGAGPRGSQPRLRHVVGGGHLDVSVVTSRFRKRLTKTRSVVVSSPRVPSSNHREETARLRTNTSGTRTQLNPSKIKLSSYPVQHSTVLKIAATLRACLCWWCRSCLERGGTGGGRDERGRSPPRGEVQRTPGGPYRQTVSGNATESGRCCFFHYPGPRSQYFVDVRCSKTSGVFFAAGVFAV